MVNALIAAGFGLCFLFLVFRPLELAFPAKPGQRLFRRSWLTDLCFFLGHHLGWGALVVSFLTQLRDWLGCVVPSAFRQAVAGQPWWLQAAEAVVLSDLFLYWGHRLQHSVGLLWRFHAVHHSSEQLDWLAANREHPLDTLYTMTVVHLPPLALGFPLETVAGLLLFRGVWAAYLHANVRLPIGPLRVLLGAPELHHWHHAKSRSAGNYANLCPLMDLLFGTYCCPDHEPEEFGVRHPTARTFLGLIVRPFLRRRIRAEALRQNEVNTAAGAAGVVDGHPVAA